MGRMLSWFAAADDWAPARGRPSVRWGHSRGARSGCSASPGLVICRTASGLGLIKRHRAADLTAHTSSMSPPYGAGGSQLETCTSRHEPLLQGEPSTEGKVRGSCGEIHEYWGVLRCRSKAGPQTRKSLTSCSVMTVTRRLWIPTHSGPSISPMAFAR